MITSTIKVKNSSGAWEVIKDKTATDYSDNNLKTAKAYTDTAKSAAISTAAADATTKANSAKSAAVSAAATDATAKANAAQSNAISSAATAASKIYVKGASSDGAMLTFTRGDGTTFSSLVVGDNAAAHNTIYRGKDLTAYFDSGEMSKAIAAGTFRDIFPGDYINKAMTVNGTSIGTVKWLVADLDYWLYGGDNSVLTAHHAVMIPEDVLDVNIRMNASNDTTGAYLGSEMWKTTLPLYTTAIQSAFGSDHVLSHREWLTNAITADLTNATGLGWTGASTGGTWIDVPGANLMNEVMVYGHAVYSSSGYDNASCVDQLALFSLDHKARITGYRGNRTDRKWWWLRAVASASRFCGASDDGDASYTDAALQAAWSGLRPYFLLR